MKLGAATLKLGRLSVVVWYDFSLNNGEKAFGITWWPRAWIGVSLMFMGVRFEWIRSR